MSKDSYIMLDRLMRRVAKVAPELTNVQQDVVSNAILEAMEFGRIEMAGEIIRTIEDKTVAGYTFD